MRIILKATLFFAILILSTGRTSGQTAIGFTELGYTENKGQVSDQNNMARPDVLFSGTNGGMAYHLKTNGISYQLSRVDLWKEEMDMKLAKKIKRPGLFTTYRLDLEWTGCNTHARVQGDEVLSGYDNYYKGSCPEGANEVKTYSGVWYKSIYRGIDLHFYQKEGSIKYDYLLEPGADYTQIEIRVKGAEKISVNNEGDLTIYTPLGNITEPSPLVMQEGRVLKAKWVLNENVLGFEIRGVNAAKPMIIDPLVRVWGTYFGNQSGNNFSQVYCTVTNPQGEVYVSGETGNSGALIATTGAHQATFGGGGGDAFIVKFNAAGQRLWGTYYGGNGEERGYACAVDGAGDIYLTGASTTTGPAPGNGIATVGSYQPTNASGIQSENAFLAKFNSSGQRLWGTYFGGSATEHAFTCTTDGAGNVYIGGQAYSYNGIATPGCYQPFLLGNGDSFFAKFNSLGVRLWGTYLGGSATMGVDAVLGCAADNFGYVYLCGSIVPGPTLGTPGAFQPNFIGGENDGFLAKFDTLGAMVWATYYGTTIFAGTDEVSACVTDANGNVYIAGNAVSPNAFTITPPPAPSPASLIATPGTHQPLPSPGSGYDPYLVKFNASGTRQWGTFFGYNARVHDCALDVIGNLYIVGGSSGSTTTTPGCHQPVYAGMGDTYLAKFNASAALQYSSFYGGAREEIAHSCAVDPSGNVYVAGFTNSYDGTSIATPGSYQPTYGGNPLNGAITGFLARFSDCSLITSALTKTDLLCATISAGSATVTASASGSPLTYSWLPGGSTSSVITGLNAGTYTCLITSSCGANALETTTILAPPQLNLSLGMLNQLICVGETNTLTANGSGGTGAIIYSWSAGATSIGPNTATVQPSTHTDYSCTAIDVNGCAITMSITQNVSQCVWIENLSHVDDIVRLYPNPTKGELTLESNEIVTVEVINTIGQIILAQTLPAGKNKIGFEACARGIYFVELKIEQKIKVIKVVRE